MDFFSGSMVAVFSEKQTEVYLLDDRIQWLYQPLSRSEI